MPSISSSSSSIHRTIVCAILLLHCLLNTAVASWYSEICHTGPRYKVRLDEVTGMIVPVYDDPPFAESDKDARENGGMTSHGVFYDNSDIFSSGIFDKKDDDTPADGNDDSARPGYDTQIPTPATQWPTADSSDWDNGLKDINNDVEDGDFGGSLGDGVRRLLRSTHLWRELDEDSETDAIVVRADDRLGADPSLADRLAEWVFGEDQHRSLHHKPYRNLDDDLKEGEFYVKPCLCTGSRWTFRENAGLPPTDYNETTDTLTQDTSAYYGEGMHPRYSNPQNYGQHYSSGQYVYVPNNIEAGDLYLCNVQSMYCGIPVVDNPTDGSEESSLSFLKRSGSSDQQKRQLFDVRGLDGGPPIVKCYSQNMRHIIARNAWPLILLWYFGLAIICCCTVHGKTAGDYVLDQVTRFGKTILCCVCRNDDRIRQYDFNDTMLHRMLDDDDQERRRRNRGRRPNANNQDDEDAARPRPWWFSHQRLQFERSLLAQVQWIWRHQEYLRELSMREQGLPPPQLRLRVKKFSNATSTSLGKDGGFGEGNEIFEPGETDSKPPGSSKKKPHRAERRASNGSITGRISQAFARRASNETTNSINSNTIVEEEGCPPTDATVTTATDTTATDTNANYKTDDDSDEDDNSVEDDAKLKADASDDKKLPGEKQCEDEEESDEDDDLEYVAIDLGPDTEDGEDSKPDADETAANAVSCIPCEEDDDDLDSLDLPTCAICFMPFEEGDRIADLPCKHEFHVDCLKIWVQRKNSCPLCNVRLGRPERPMPAGTVATSTTNSLSVETASNTDNAGVERGLLRRIGRGLRRDNNNNNTSRATTATRATIGAGEVRVGSRIGIIGAISAAEDINSTQNMRRSGAFPW